MLKIAFFFSFEGSQLTEDVSKKCFSFFLNFAVESDSYRQLDSLLYWATPS